MEKESAENDNQRKNESDKTTELDNKVEVANYCIIEIHCIWRFILHYVLSAQNLIAYFILAIAARKTNPRRKTSRSWKCVAIQNNRN